MNNIKQNLALFIAIISLLISGILLYEKLSTKKIAYIRSSELVYGYLGMQEAHRNFEQKSATWSANVDTLKADYQRAVNRYTTEAAGLGKEEQLKRENNLKQQQENLMRYSQAINDKAKQEDDKITQSVLNQINSFVEEYGKSHNYEVILGTTSSGSLLYGKETMDITKEVLEALNRNYKGEPIN